MAHSQFSLSHQNSIYPFLIIHKSHSLHFQFSKPPKKIQTFSSSKQSVHVHVTPTKRKPRPSFFEQIRDKWSVKLPSPRHEFPWQVPEEERCELDDDDVESSVEVCGNENADKRVSFSVSNAYVSAPWVPKRKHIDTHVEFESERLRIDSDNDRIGEEIETESLRIDSDNDRIGEEIETESLRIDAVNRTGEDETVFERESLPIDSDNRRIGEEDSVFERESLRIDSDNRRIEEETVFERESLRIDSDNRIREETVRGFRSFRDNDSVDCVDVEKEVNFRENSEGETSAKIDASPSLEDKKKQAESRSFDRDVFLSRDNSNSKVLPWERNRNFGLTVEGNEKINNTELGMLSSSLVDKKKQAVSRPFNGDVSSSRENSHSRVLPWEGKGDLGLSVEGNDKGRKGNTELAESMLPEHELKRLRSIALRMYERTKVGVAGVTQALVDSIHDKWKLDEVVKLKFEEPLSLNMRRTHEILERKTGGLVIWRSGSSIVLFRGMNYKLPCVQSYTKKIHGDGNVLPYSQDAKTDSFIPDSMKYIKDLSNDEQMDFYELNDLLNKLGPRFKDWTGREPLPVDADLLPAVVPGYKPPCRLLPYGVRHCLHDRETTILRRLARTMPPHFALGRNRELQGLAKAMVKLWERTVIAKIAIKRGVENTRNERMAEELKDLTGGTLLSRNVEYIVFYRGNDFLPPLVRDAVIERQSQTVFQHDEEELARQTGVASIGLKAKTSNNHLIAGTLGETIAASSRWGKQPNSKDVEEMKKESTLTKQALLVKLLERKLAFAKWKLAKADRALAKVQKDLNPTDVPTDLETITNEERFLFRKMGLSMKPFLLLGKRGVFDGTIENMHLHWKYRELVKILVRGKNIAQVKHIAISLEAESGGVLVSLDKTTKGYMVIVYRGKNYRRPQALRPGNLLSRREALAQSVELQRREALKHHILDLEQKYESAKSELGQIESGRIVSAENIFNSRMTDAYLSKEHILESNGKIEIF